MVRVMIVALCVCFQTQKNGLQLFTIAWILAKKDTDRKKLRHGKKLHLLESPFRVGPHSSPLTGDGRVASRCGKAHQRRAGWWRWWWWLSERG